MLMESRDHRDLEVSNIMILLKEQELIANEPAERRRSAGEAAENSATWRMLYVCRKILDQRMKSVSVRCNNCRF